MTNETHSPLPWRVDVNCAMHGADVIRDADGVFVAKFGSRTDVRSGAPCEPHNPDDPQFVLRCVNAHGDLLAALKEAFVALPMAKHNEDLLSRMKAAIQKAEQG